MSQQPALPFSPHPNTQYASLGEACAHEMDQRLRRYQQGQWNPYATGFASVGPVNQLSETQVSVNP